MPWIVGVDAGGTHTRAAAWNDETGAVRTGAAEGANWTVHGPDLCRERIARAVREALPPDLAPDGLAVCMAGYYPPDHGVVVGAWLAAAWPEVRARLATTDVVGAWAGAHGGESGVVLIGGTGSICYGRLLDGREARAGGWGPLFNDQGSGYAVGLACLRALADQVDGIGPATRLADRVMARWPHPGEAGAPLEGMRSWLRGIYRHKWDREAIARLSEEVSAAAREGDAVAEGILLRAGEDLAEMARAVERALGEPGLPLAYQGGFLTAASGLQVEAALRRRGSSLEVAAPRFTPLEGALLLAAEAVGGRPALEQVRSSLS